MSHRQDNLRLNQRDRRFLGVCAGIADYFDVPVVLVRIICVICIISWPPMILVYFGVYFCLDRNITSEKVQDFFNQGMDGEYFRKLNYNRPLYRNTSNCCIAGVCSGIAAYLDVKTVFVRAAFILSLFFFGPFGVLAYIVCWIAIEPDPHGSRYSSRDERRTARKQHREEKRAAKHLRRAEQYRNARSHFSPSRINVEPGSVEDPLNENYAEFGGYTDVTKNRKSAAEGSRMKKERNPVPDETALQQCAELYRNMESRMREIEAYITSKRFRLHCEINRA
jgi:phage shock protein C